MKGDALASGSVASAQFGRADITQLEQDFIYIDAEGIRSKYGLSEAEYDKYAALRLDGQHLPDIRPTCEQEEVGVGFSITDHRKSYENVTPVVEKVKKFPEREYDVSRPILDRILVMTISDSPDEELLEDGSTRSRKTGLITTAKYRQHSNIGIVLAAGRHVVLGGIYFSMTDFVKVGDKVTYGDYNSELFKMSEEKAQALCDGLGINYEPSALGLRIVRIQDVRVVDSVKPVEEK